MNSLTSVHKHFYISEKRVQLEAVNRFLWDNCRDSLSGTWVWEPLGFSQPCDPDTLCQFPHEQNEGLGQDVSRVPLLSTRQHMAGENAPICSVLHPDRVSKLLRIFALHFLRVHSLLPVCISMTLENELASVSQARAAHPQPQHWNPETRLQGQQLQPGVFYTHNFSVWETKMEGLLKVLAQPGLQCNVLSQKYPTKPNHHQHQHQIPTPTQMNNILGSTGFLQSLLQRLVEVSLPNRETCLVWSVI